MLLVVGIGMADYLTGSDLSFGLFYLAPVSLLSWFVPGVSGQIGALICAFTWLAANALAVPSEIDPQLQIWNTAIRFGTFFIIASLVISLRKAYRRERDYARIDSLTGVFNGRVFHELAELELMRAGRLGYPITMLYIDMNHFKELNDVYGHRAGDEFLAEIGAALKRTLRATDLVGRLGGDEFAVLLPNTTQQQAGAVVHKISEAIGGVARDTHRRITASIGAATVEPGSGTATDLIAAADQQMYAEKFAGRSVN